MARQPHIQQPGLIHTAECYAHPSTQKFTWQAICRCGKVIKAKNRKQLATNQKAHYTRCTKRSLKIDISTGDIISMEGDWCTQ